MWLNSYKHNLHEGHMLHVYDFLVRVPLVLRWRGRLPAGIACPRMVRLVDALPTVLDLLDIDPRTIDGLDGVSFRPLIENRPWQPQPAYLSVSGVPRDLELRGVRTEEYKYTYGPHNAELPEELYDLRRDPAEADNRADADAALCRQLRQLANQFVPAQPRLATAPLTISPDEQARVERRLHELGYL
jgi:arylsulfatase A-like enzyme